MFNTHNCRPPTYLNIDVKTCKVLGLLNLHRLYRNLHKFTPLFEKFTKIYVIYSANWIWHPAPHPLFPGLVRGHSAAHDTATLFTAWKHMHLTVEQVSRSTISPQDMHCVCTGWSTSSMCTGLTTHHPKLVTIYMYNMFCPQTCASRPASVNMRSHRAICTPHTPGNSICKVVQPSRPSL